MGDAAQLQDVSKGATCNWVEARRRRLQQQSRWENEDPESGQKQSHLDSAFAGLLGDSKSSVFDDQVDRFKYFEFLFFVSFTVLVKQWVWNCWKIVLVIK